MFDIAFTEMIIIFVVLLLVVGPNRLPGLVRTIGFWMGRARRVVSDIQTDMEREANRIDALKKSVEQPMTELKKAVSDTARDPEKTILPDDPSDMQRDTQSDAQNDTQHPDANQDNETSVITPAGTHLADTTALDDATPDDVDESTKKANHVADPINGQATDQTANQATKQITKQTNKQDESQESDLINSAVMTKQPVKSDT